MGMSYALFFAIDAVLRCSTLYPGSWACNGLGARAFGEGANKGSANAVRTSWVVWGMLSDYLADVLHGFQTCR